MDELATVEVDYIGMTNLICLFFIIPSNSSIYDSTVPAGGRGASVSACAGLTNQLLSCWVDPSIAWIKH